MEKTALQQLAIEIDSMIENTEKYSKERFNLEVLRKTVMKPYFKVEKIQITDAFCAAYSLSNGEKVGDRLAEQYYNCVFNPNSFEKTE